MSIKLMFYVPAGEPRGASSLIPLKLPFLLFALFLVAAASVYTLTALLLFIFFILCRLWLCQPPCCICQISDVPGDDDEVLSSKLDGMLSANGLSNSRVCFCRLPSHLCVAPFAPLSNCNPNNAIFFFGVFYLPVCRQSWQRKVTRAQAQRQTERERLCLCVCVCVCVRERLCVCVYASLSEPPSPLFLSHTLTHAHTHTCSLPTNLCSSAPSVFVESSTLQVTIACADWCIQSSAPAICCCPAPLKITRPEPQPEPQPEPCLCYTGRPPHGKPRPPKHHLRWKKEHNELWPGP